MTAKAQKEKTTRVASNDSSETLEELFARAMGYGQITVSQTEYDPMEGEVQRGFYTTIQMWGEEGIDLTVKSDYISPTIQSSLHEVIGKARQAKLLMAERA